MDVLIPGSGAVKDVLGAVSEERLKRGLRWQGFVVEARELVKRAER